MFASISIEISVVLSQDRTVISIISLITERARPRSNQRKCLPHRCGTCRVRENTHRPRTLTSNLQREFE